MRGESNEGSDEGSTGRGWRGALEALAVVVFFASFGLAWAEVEARAPGVPPPYPHPVVEDVKSRPPTPSMWLIDGFNVLHVGLLGGRDRSEWWTAARRDQLLEKVARFDDPRAQVWVVFDGPRPEVATAEDADQSGEGPRRVFAASADAWLVERVAAAEDPERIAVVTADRQVAGRVRHRGAQVHSPRDFLARCSG
jgi:predicted RNA-binding protein with PIN domain